MKKKAPRPVSTKPALRTMASRKPVSDNIGGDFYCPDPLNPRVCRLSEDIIQCGENGDQCCGSEGDAVNTCKRKYGPDWGFGSVTAKQATTSATSTTGGRPFKTSTSPILGCGPQYQCYADISPWCESKTPQSIPYNTDGPAG